jgi:hypothetical protein
MIADAVPGDDESSERRTSAERQCRSADYALWLALESVSARLLGTVLSLDCPAIVQ